MQLAYSTAKADRTIKLYWIISCQSQFNNYSLLLYIKNVSMILNRSVRLINETLAGTTILSQSGHGSNGNEGGNFRHSKVAKQEIHHQMQFNVPPRTPFICFFFSCGERRVLTSLYTEYIQHILGLINRVRLDGISKSLGEFLSTSAQLIWQNDHHFN